GELRRLDMGDTSQRMVARHDEHLLVVEHGLVGEALPVERVGCDEEIDLPGEQRPEAAELELLLHVHVDAGPGGEIGRDDAQQPLVARVALHADAQGAALAARELPQPRFGPLELRQHPPREREQVLASLRQPQVATLAQPERRAGLPLQLLDAVAERRLREAQDVGRRRQRSQPVDLPKDGEVAALEHMNATHESVRKDQCTSWGWTTTNADAI